MPYSLMKTVSKTESLLHTSYNTVKQERKYLLLGLAIVVILFLFMEYQHPYTFLKDDNLNQFLPVVLEGMKQLEQRSLPVWNPYQYTGTPLLEIGTYAVLYPGTWISYAIARMLGNTFATFEIFALMHLLLGYLMMFVLVKRKVSAKVACLSALSFVFSGYILIAARNWYYVLPSAVFLPTIFYLLHRANEEDNLKLWIYLGIVRGMYFYGGNAQYVAYTALFEIVYLLLLAKREYKNSLEVLEKFGVSVLITAIIVAPLALAQLGIAQLSSRGDHSPLDYLLTTASHPLDTLLGQFITYPLYKAQDTFAKAPSSFSNLYYYGTLFFIAVIFAIIRAIRERGKAWLKQVDPAIILGLCAIILSWGWRGIVYSIGVILPIFNDFTHPFKITLYVAFFFCMGGAQEVEERLEKYGKKKWITGAIFCILILLLAWHSTVATQTAYSETEDNIPLVTKFPAEMQKGRIITVSYLRESEYYKKNRFDIADLKGSEFLTYNFATYHELMHIAGYEPFISRTIEKNIPITRNAVRDRINVDRLKEYGVRWIILPTDSLVEREELKELPKKQETKEYTILEIENAKDLVFDEKNADRKIKYKRTSRGYLVEDVFEKETTIVFNTIDNNNIEITVNGKKAAKEKDNFDRIRVEISKGNNSIEMRYVPKKFYGGILLSGALFLGAMLYIKGIRKRYSGRCLNKIAEISRKATNTETRKILLIVLLVGILMIAGIQEMTKEASIKGILKRSTGLNVNIGESRIVGWNKIAIEKISITNRRNDPPFMIAERIEATIDIPKSILSVLKERKITMKEIRIENMQIMRDQNEKEINKMFEIRPLEQCSLEGEEDIKKVQETITISLLKIPEGYIKFNSFGVKNVIIKEKQVDIEKKVNHYKITGDKKICLEVSRATKLYG